MTRRVAVGAWPWCEACQSYHHPDNPTCKALRYLDWARVEEHKRAHYERSPSISGYGTKLPTTWMVKIDGHWHRVWAINHSNSASFYVLIQGKRHFIHGYDLP